jgi:hypothetical protein
MLNRSNSPLTRGTTRPRLTAAGVAFERPFVGIYCVARCARSN